MADAGNGRHLLCGFADFDHNSNGCAVVLAYFRAFLKNRYVRKNAQKLLYIRRESPGRLSPDKDFDDINSDLWAF